MGDLIYNYRYSTIFIISGFIFLGMGIFFFTNQSSRADSNIEIINTSSNIIIEISGAVNLPGVYELSQDSRVEDALVKAGGFAPQADLVWVEKNINRAKLLEDGTKLYIPRQTDTGTANITGQTNTESGGGNSAKSGLVDINTASLGELDSLPGIGPVYAQNIVEHRPYSTVDDLLKTGALKTAVYTKVKEMVAVY